MAAVSLASESGDKNVFDSAMFRKRNVAIFPQKSQKSFRKVLLFRGQATNAR